MKLEKKSHSQVGQYGVYYASAMLSIRGFNVAPTMRNTGMIDIVIQNPVSGRATGVQVKTQRRTRKDVNNDYFLVRKGSPARIDEEEEFKVPFVLVYYEESNNKTRCFAVPKEEMLPLCRKYWAWYKDNKTHRKSDYGQKGHLSIGVWQLHDYEDRWENLGIG